MVENQYQDKKSLKMVTGSTAKWGELAKDCVCFGNAKGGTIIIGIEDNEDLPKPEQMIDTHLVNQIYKRISELTINVSINVGIEKAENGGEYIQVVIHPNISNIASTTDGKYYFRTVDQCKPILPSELLRLLTDKPAFNWETQISANVNRKNYDDDKAERFLKKVADSIRISTFIKNKSKNEIFDYYLFTSGEYLTNLGVLWIGRREDRAKLQYAPIIQYLKYDENGKRVNKIVWDDYYLNPQELIESVWNEIPDWKEGIEVSDGIFRKFILNYEEAVIRELIVNALVHRPYTTSGDIFINLYPDRLEIHNPGLLPLGITTQNMLHKTLRRNEHLAKVFYDLMLMEREGTGYDKIYEILLSNGKAVPEPIERDDRFYVIIRKRIINPEILSFLNRITIEFQLRQKEIICLGLIAQYNTLSALEFSKILGLQGQSSIQDWLGRLIHLEIVSARGRTKGMEYFVNPLMLQKVSYKGKTNLKGIEDHRLKELIYQDLLIYPQSSIGEIWQRIGIEIPKRKIKHLLDKMVLQSDLSTFGDKRWRKYSVKNMKTD